MTLEGKLCLDLSADSEIKSYLNMSVLRAIPPSGDMMSTS